MPVPVGFDLGRETPVHRDYALRWFVTCMWDSMGGVSFLEDWTKLIALGLPRFAGGGGSSNGIMRALRALRVPCILAMINHWDTAIATQVLNFPFAIHYNASVETPDPRSVIPWLHVDLAVFSPECVS